MSQEAWQAVHLRNLAWEALQQAQQLPGETAEEQVLRARAIADLTRSWETASERLRILRGKPLPGSLRPGQVKDKPARRGSVAPLVLPAPEGLEVQAMSETDKSAACG